MPDPVARDGDIRVGLVLSKGKTFICRKLSELGAADLEQWADDNSGLWPDASETTRPRSTQEAEQERLRLIVPAVADRHSVCSEPVGRSREKLVTHPAGRVLDRALSFACECAHIPGADLEGDAELCRDLPAERLVRIGCSGAELVIEVGSARQYQ